ncbi:MAG: hypothetical protein ACYSUP_16845 [Planctomycetota bacterium]|jgi:hypothetical protein
MFRVRAKTKDGKEKEKEVVGWYCEIAKVPHIIPPTADFLRKRSDTSSIAVHGLIPIDPATAAYDTGKLDKHGKRIYGSKGEMQGGDSVIASGVDTPSCVYWHAGSNYGQWVMESDEYIRPLYGWESSGLEIITAEKGK